MRRVFLTFTACILLAAGGDNVAAQPTAGQPYPARAVHLIVPFSAGSQTDILARVLGDKLEALWGQPVIIENRPGIPGTAAVAISRNDGYTLMFTSNGHTLLRALNKDVPFDPVKEFSGVTFTATFPLMLLVNPDVSAKDVGELIAQAKSAPGTMNFASHGLGSTLYVAALLFAQAAKIDVVHVPYRGAPDALTGLMRGDVQFYFAGPNVATELIAANKIRAIAITGSSRDPAMPNLPTIAEGSLSNFSYEVWLGLLAPAGVSGTIREKVAKDVAQVLSTPEMKAKWRAQGVSVATNTPAEFDAIIEGDTLRFTGLLKNLRAGN